MSSKPSLLLMLFLNHYFNKYLLVPVICQALTWKMQGVSKNIQDIKCIYRETNLYSSLAGLHIW